MRPAERRHAGVAALGQRLKEKMAKEIYSPLIGLCGRGLVHPSPPKKTRGTRLMACPPGTHVLKSTGF